jgi:FecR protein
MSDYLWDRSGPADREVAELEEMFAPLRYSRPLELRGMSAPVWHRPPYRAVAAAIALAAFASLLQIPRPGNARTSWAIAGVEGAAKVGSREASKETPLLAGEPVRTGQDAHVKLEAEDFGEVELAPNSELRVTESRDGRQRMQLGKGRIHAFIWAPPGQFVVDTPSARAIDLGCAYNLSVDAAGNGYVAVETGWVAFQFGGQESFIPAGAACRTTRRSGPGIPFFEDAPASFSEALARYENTPDADALNAVLAGARSKDGLSLWHLLTRTSGETRRQVFERFAQLVRVPAEVSADRVLAGNAQAMDACWNALDLQDASFWREWKRDWKL